MAKGMDKDAPIKVAIYFCAFAFVAKGMERSEVVSMVINGLEQPATWAVFCMARVTTTKEDFMGPLTY